MDRKRFEEFKEWMREAWFFYLLVGVLFAVFAGPRGVQYGFFPTTNVLWGVLGFGIVAGIRAIQFIGYDPSAPDGD